MVINAEDRRCLAISAAAFWPTATSDSGLPDAATVVVGFAALAAVRRSGLERQTPARSSREKLPITCKRRAARTALADGEVESHRCVEHRKHGGSREIGIHANTES